MNANPEYFRLKRKNVQFEAGHFACNHLPFQTEDGLDPAMRIGGAHD